MRPDSRETAGIPVPAGAGQIGLDGDSMRPRLSLQTPQVSDEVFNRLNQTNLEQGCGGVTSRKSIYSSKFITVFLFYYV